MVKIGFKKIHPDAKLPGYAHEGDAGMDVSSIEDVDLAPYTPTLVRTGIIAEAPKGHEIQVRPRSGLALKHGVTVWNSPGCVDENYRGEIGVILFWAPSLRYSMSEKTPRFKIAKGDRIAQIVVSPVAHCCVSEVDEASETNRGSGGFGSTGLS